MLVSVVIPVYKAEEFIKGAVESALSQRETGEVILIEDNSPDGSLGICRELAASNDKVRLVRHPEGRNLGAGASRNLGVRNALYDYVAFLDADDFYLENRFTEASTLFEGHPEIDGVYEAVGVYYQDSSARQRWLSWGCEDLITMKERVSHDELFSALVEGGNGWLHLDGLVLKRSVFDRCGFFFEQLRLHQDSAFFLQLAAACRLLSGRLSEAVAMRRVHDHNRISGANTDSRALHFRTLFHWAQEQQLARRKLEILFQNYLYFAFLSMRDNKMLKSGNLAEIRSLCVDILTHPNLFISAFYRRICNRIQRV
jgi:glycosyltransferase involved in cell wall biosynthesis